MCSVLQAAIRQRLTVKKAWLPGRLTKESEAFSYK
jgi:hypothetical protein